MAYTMDSIIKADRVFTIPGIVILLIGGIGAAIAGSIAILSTGWVLWGLSAFIISGSPSDRSRAFSGKLPRQHTAVIQAGSARVSPIASVISHSLSVKSLRR